MGNGQMVLRSFRMSADFDQLTDLAEAAFAEDYRRMGENIRETARRERRGARLFGWLARISPSLRDANRGLVLEDGKRLASVVLFGRDGDRGNHWTIEAVATHPDYHRRGMARRLVRCALDRIRKLGGTLCTLKVREDNAAAYRLYRDLGFTHYDTTRHMKRPEKLVLSASKTTCSIPGLKPMVMKDWFRSSDGRFELAQRAIPEEAQRFAPVRKASFRRSRVLQWMTPLLLRIGGFEVIQWGVVRGDSLLATLRVRADKTGARPHEIKLVVDRRLQDELAGPLVDLALDSLVTYPVSNILLETRQSDGSILEAMEERGFEDMSTWHWLGARPEAVMS